MSLAVAQEVVDDHANNWEEENNESPNDFIGDRAVRLKDFNCSTNVLVPTQDVIDIVIPEEVVMLTPGDNVKNQDDD